MQMKFKKKTTKEYDHPD